MQQDTKNYAQDAEGIIDGDKLNKVLSDRNMDDVKYKEIRQAMINWKNDKDVSVYIV